MSDFFEKFGYGAHVDDDVEPFFWPTEPPPDVDDDDEPVDDGPQNSRRTEVENSRARAEVENSRPRNSGGGPRNSADGPKPGEAGPLLVPLADVEPVDVQWLWPGYLPKSRLVVVDGDPSVGKSTLAIDLVARLTSGGRWPDGAPVGEPGRALIMSAEDAVNDTILPRLLAAGGDPARVVACDAVTLPGDGGPTPAPLLLPGDRRHLRTAIEQTGADIVIIDPLSAFIDASVDTHRDAAARVVLRGLADVAEETGATVVVVRHLTKGGGAHPLYRGGGSIAIIAAARVGFLAAADPDDETGQRRVFAATKCNVASMPPALTYRITPSRDHKVGVVEWVGPSDRRAADLLRPPEIDSETDEAAAWLKGTLEAAGGTLPARQILADGRACGFSERTLQRARARAGVVTERSGFGAGGSWVWRIGANRRQAQNPGAYGAYEAPLAPMEDGGHQDQSRTVTESGGVVDTQPPDYDDADLDGVPPHQIGPCVRCRKPTRRYGPGASPLCRECRVRGMGDPQPNTSNEPNTSNAVRGMGDPQPSTTTTCEVCGGRLDPVLVDLGLRTHPTCEGW